ncbi:Ig-like domain-containing protein [Butyrivibrio sp. JL13D10]|uniref:Ig-like domain-containing protein n=1 Tax=Butyrivibrio sp. JL13D10 TaxID=3236815 RepID=UPI0038B6A3FD
MSNCRKETRNLWSIGWLTLAAIVFLQCFVVFLGTGSIDSKAKTLPTGDLRRVEVPDLIQLEVPENIERLTHKKILAGAPQQGRYYTNYISGESVAKEIYKGMQGAAQNYAPYGTDNRKIDFDSPYMYSFEITQSVYNELQIQDEFDKAYNHAMEAIIYDNIDKIELTMCTFYVSWGISTDDNKYYLGVFGIASTKDNYATMNQRLKNARVRFWNNITKKTDKPVNELIIHDALLDHITYDYEGYEVQNPTHICHTAYAALVLGKAVCDGYSQAFTYLLDYEGINIESVVVTGLGDGGGHAWNRVKLDGNWYEVDTTWDDADDTLDEDDRHDWFNKTTPLSYHETPELYIGNLMNDIRATGTTYTYEALKNSYIPQRVTTITRSPESVALTVGESAQVKWAVSPGTATNRNVKWLTSNSSVADVDDGVITAIGPGTATITVVASSTSSVYSTISVKVASLVSGIQLDKSALTLNIGDSATLLAQILPEDAGNKKCRWTTSDSAVATVDNGQVTALKDGTATITAISDENSNITASCIVSVAKAKGGSIVIKNGAATGKYTVTSGDVPSVIYKKETNKNVKSASIPSNITDENGVVYTVTEVGANAFKGLKKLKKVVIAETVTQIGKGAFKDCGNLKTIKIKGGNLTKVGSGAFKNLHKDVKITVYAKSKKEFNRISKKIKKAGAKNATFKWKKSK